jgi:hypothetical protein
MNECERREKGENGKIVGLKIEGALIDMIDSILACHARPALATRLVRQWP